MSNLYDPKGASSVQSRCGYRAISWMPNESAFWCADATIFLVKPVTTIRSMTTMQRIDEVRFRRAAAPPFVM
jgi:hypothetical protein